MAARFREHPAAVAETAAVAEQLDFDLTSDLGYRYPGVEDETAQRRLGELCDRATRIALQPGPAWRWRPIAWRRSSA